MAWLRATNILATPPCHGEKFGMPRRSLRSFSKSLFSKKFAQKFNLYVKIAKSVPKENIFVMIFHLPRKVGHHCISSLSLCCKFISLFFLSLTIIKFLLFGKNVQFSLPAQQSKSQKMKTKLQQRKMFDYRKHSLLNYRTIKVKIHNYINIISYFIEKFT